MKDIKKIDEKDLAVKTPAQAEQILEQEKEAIICLKKLVAEAACCWSSAGCRSVLASGGPGGRGGRKRGGERKPFTKKPTGP